MMIESNPLRTFFVLLICSGCVGKTLPDPFYTRNCEDFVYGPFRPEDYREKGWGYAITVPTKAEVSVMRKLKAIRVSVSFRRTDIEKVVEVLNTVQTGCDRVPIRLVFHESWYASAIVYEVRSDNSEDPFSDHGRKIRGYRERPGVSLIAHDTSLYEILDDVTRQIPYLKIQMTEDGVYFRAGNINRAFYVVPDMIGDPDGYFWRDSHWVLRDPLSHEKREWHLCSRPASGESEMIRTLKTTRCSVAMDRIPLDHVSDMLNGCQKVAHVDFYAESSAVIPKVTVTDKGQSLYDSLLEMMDQCPSARLIVDKRGVLIVLKAADDTRTNVED